MRIIVWIFLLIGISACSNNTNYSKSSEQTVAAAIPVNKVEHSLFLEENIDLIGKRIQNFFRLTDSTSLVVSEEKLRPIRAAVRFLPTPNKLRNV